MPKVGGARPGAGRPKGAPNKKTAALQAEVAANGITPLQFMLNRMRDETREDADRFAAAVAAAPYIHPKLSSVEAKLDAEVKGTIRKIERRVVDPLNPDA